MIASISLSILTTLVTILMIVLAIDYIRDKITGLR